SWSAWPAPRSARLCSRLLLVRVWGVRNPCKYAPFRGGARQNPHKSATIWAPSPKVRKIAALSRPTPPVRNPPPPRFQTPVARRQVASSYKVTVARPTSWHWRPLLAWRLATPLAPSDLRTEGCPMFHGTRPGWIEVIAGVMFSGKSEEMIRRVRRAVLAGIDMDFRGLPFGPVPTLLAIAEIVDKLQAICVVCGGPASRNQRLVNGKPAVWNSPTIMVGGRESYEARCRHCHKVPRADEDQTALL